ncbi:MAG: sugar phosphate isomerase/epimerase [Hadesarchaea archaeon CG08_land_8_20_14_0_20_51_8]|jgi:sugar phosphate isomerase/epimerase|nr:MAG: sugar phosphate isomerase/epimerase [Hadesarchaea archaeon CG08_land_8_20_14_0_20_51_8]
MKIGVMNSPRNNLLKEIKWISENGFDFIDLTIEPLEAYKIDVKKIKEALRDFCLEAIGHTNPFLPSILPIQSIRKVCLDEFKKYIDIFNKLGIELVNIHPFYEAPLLSDEDKIKANIQFLRQVNALCKSKKITLMLENYIKPFDSPEVFARILKEVSYLKIHLDVSHCNINQEKNLTEAFFKKFGDKIVHLHFSDNKGKADDHLPLGCGNIEWEKIIKIIKKFKFDRTITLEVFSPDRDYLLLSRDKLKNWWK